MKDWVHGIFDGETKLNNGWLLASSQAQPFL